MTEWNRILREKWYSQEEPEEIVVNFANFLKTKAAKGRVLDLGCGAGRHPVYMAQVGFEAYGIDTSETGLNLAKERLARQNLSAHLVKCDMKMLPYVGSCFNAIVSLNAVYHQRLEGIQQTISEMRRILKKGGFLLTNFLSKRTYSYGKGAKIEENTFIEQDGVERGVLHHFTNKEELERLFESFKIIDVRLSERMVEGKLRSRWILTAML